LENYFNRYKYFIFTIIIYIPILISSSKYLDFLILYTLLNSLFLTFLIKYNNFDLINFSKNTYFLIFLSFFFIIFQILPWNDQIIRYLSPQSFEYYGYLGSEVNKFITLNPLNTLKSLFIYLSIILIFLICRNLIKKKRDLQKIFKSFVIITIIYLLYSFIRFFYNSNLLDFSSTIINRNHFCFYLVICFTTLITYINFYNQYFIKKNFFKFLFSEITLARITIIIICIGIILTKSRSGNLTFLIVLISYFCIDFYQYKKITFLGKVLISIFIIDIGILNYFIGLDVVIDRISNTSFIEEHLRIDVFTFSLDQIKNFIFFGYGLGNFETIFRLEYALNETFYDHVHNDYLEYFGELGIVGSVIFLYSFFTIIAKTINSQKLNILKIQIIMILIAITFHSIFDFALHMPSIIFLLSFIIGISSCKLNRSVTPTPLKKI